MISLSVNGHLGTFYFFFNYVNLGEVLQAWIPEGRCNLNNTLYNKHGGPFPPVMSGHWLESFITNAFFFFLRRDRDAAQTCFFKKITQKNNTDEIRYSCKITLTKYKKQKSKHRHLNWEAYILFVEFFFFMSAEIKSVNPDTLTEINTGLIQPPASEPCNFLNPPVRCVLSATYPSLSAEKILHLNYDLFPGLWTAQLVLLRTFCSVLTDYNLRGFEGDSFNS